MKPSFLFYFEWRKAMQHLSDNERLAIYDAICDFAENGIRPEGFEGMAAMAFDLIAGSIERDNEKYKDVSLARSIAGQKGNAVRWGKKENEDNRNCDICDESDTENTQLKIAKSQKSQNRETEKERTKEKEERETDKEAENAMRASACDALSFDAFRSAFGEHYRYGPNTIAAWAACPDWKRQLIIEDLRGPRRHVKKESPYITIEDFVPDIPLYRNGDSKLTEFFQKGTTHLWLVKDQQGKFAFVEEQYKDIAAKVGIQLIEQRI